MKKQRLVKVSPWVLAAACTLLTLIIGVFAVNNYQREKELMSEALLQQGITIVRFVISSSRASMRGSLRNINVAMWKWTDHVQQAIDNTSDQPGLRFISLVKQDGTIIASSNKQRVGTKIEPSTKEYIENLKEDRKAGGTYRIKSGSVNEESVFQVIARYQLFGSRVFEPRVNQMGPPFMHGPEIGRMFGQGKNRRFTDDLAALAAEKYTILVELDLSQFNQAVKSQLLQILILSLILLLVGIGGWLSLLTLQGLKGSQMRLSRITLFTDNLISSLPVGLVATDSEGNIQIYNTSAEDIIGITSEHVIGQQPGSVLPVELSDVLQRGGIAGNKPFQQETGFVDRKGVRRTLLLASLPVVDQENRHFGSTLLVQDITQVKQLETEVRRNERLAALGKMAAGVAHELRNPLSSIKGLAVLLRSRLMKERQGIDTADILVQEVERLDRSIGELLDYARPQKLKKERVVLREILEKAVTLISVDAEATGITLKSDFDKPSLLVFGDGDKLTQVILNLLLNSIQAMEEGGILSIAVESDAERIICLIEDTGCGLAQENVSKVFDPYFTTKSDGTGLGLAMSAKIIEEHNGMIEFSSEPEVGTTVKIVLPCYHEES
jgi:two-component system sensor histidine kinase HydH